MRLRVYTTKIVFYRNGFQVVSIKRRGLRYFWRGMLEHVFTGDTLFNEIRVIGDDGMELYQLRSNGFYDLSAGEKIQLNLTTMAYTGSVIEIKAVTIPQKETPDETN